MKQIVKLLALGGVLLGIGIAIADTNDPTTFLGPTLHLDMTNPLSPTAAYSLLGEIGNNNARVGATMGFRVYENQLFKVSGEYLWQDINYHFVTGNSKEWVRQGAIGAAYEYLLGDFVYPTAFDFSGYMSYANNKRLGDAVLATTNEFGDTIDVVYNRRIAGSKAFGFAPGLAVLPWTNGRIGLSLNYDKVLYDTIYSDNSHDAIGFGGTFNFDQGITDAFDVGVSAAIRAPFNNYEARIYWNNLYNNGHWSIGVFGDYTDGKNTLPTTWLVGLGGSFSFDTFLGTPVHSGPRTLGFNRLVDWTARPAVYMPQVLAIAESRTEPGPTCLNGVPRLISDVQNFGDTALNNPISQHFSGKNLIYTINSLNPDLVFGDEVSVHPTRGEVTIFDNSDTFYRATIRATNDCGSVVSNVFTINAPDFKV